jgi:hypothetical protein
VAGTSGEELSILIQKKNRKSAVEQILGNTNIDAKKIEKKKYF